MTATTTNDSRTSLGSSSHLARSLPEPLLHAAAALILLAAGLLLASWPPVNLPAVALMSVIGSFALAIHGSRSRSLVLAYVVLCGIAFVLAPILGGQPIADMAHIWVLVAAWFVGWSSGQYIADAFPPRDNQRHRASLSLPWRQIPLIPVLILAVSALLVQGVLLWRDEVGFVAQLRGFSSTGPVAIFASVGPVSVATAYLVTRLRPSASTSLRAFTFALAIGQALALAMTGFRGSAPLYLLTMWVVRKRWQANWPPNLQRLLLAALAIVSITALFTLGSRTRAEDATVAGRTSAGTEVAPLLALPQVVVARLDYYPPMDAALTRASSRAARVATAPTSQLVAFVPRTLWPEKPHIDYGQRVAHAFFDVPPSYRTSSTITWLGDLFVQGGKLPIALILLVGLALAALLKRWLMRPTPVDVVHVATYFLIAEALLSLESPIIIAAANVLRILLAFIALCVLLSCILRLAPNRP